MAENLGNLSYLTLKKETDKGIAVIPDVSVPYYEESMSEILNVDEDTPNIGNKAARYQVLPGMREYRGDITVLGEPNTAARFFDMLLTKGTTTGSNPYTHPFTLSNTVNPNSYTVDIKKGQIVHRYIGVETSAISPAFDANKMTLRVTLSALGCFSVRKIASVDSLELTLTTDHEPTAPTKGLVDNDLVRIFKADGSVIDTTVTDLTDGVVTVASATGVAAGDKIAIRAATPSYTTVTPFLLARTEFRFADTAANALTADQTRLETDSSWTVKHAFNNDGGEKRSGSFNPASLARKLGDVEFNTKQFFDTVDDYNAFLSLEKKACVIRHFSGAGHELRITLNNLRQSEFNVPVNSDEIIYAEATYLPTYDTSDAQAFDVKVINAISSI